MLNKPGFISILGKSGSGKTTLANIVSLLDLEIDGSVYINGESIKKWSTNKKESFRNTNIGVVFQHYNLLEKESVAYNIALPLLIDGINEKDAFSSAETLLEKIDFPKDLYYAKTENLSGGEMQRVAILRAVIRNPLFIIADEPTGALDEKNSFLIMDLLKKISKKKCVLVISHNSKLINRYSDRVIKIEDGKIVEDIVNYSNDKPLAVSPPSFRKNKRWIDRFSLALTKRSKVRNLTFVFSLFFGFCFLNVSSAINDGTKRIIEEGPRKIFSYTSFNISSKITMPIANTSFSMTKISRLDDYVLKKYETEYSNLDILPSFEALMKNDSYFFSKNNIEYNFLLSPVRAFDRAHINCNLVIEKTPYFLEPNTIIVNEKAYEILTKENDFDVINDWFSFNFHRPIYYYVKDVNNSFIIDDFQYLQSVKIGGVVSEFDFLCEPCIYYSYEEFSNNLKNYPLVNISKALDKNIDVVSYINSASSDDEITSYSHNAFLKNIKDIDEYENDLSKLQKDKSIEVESNALIRKKAFSSFVSITNIAMQSLSVFVIIGSLLLLGIISYSSFVLYRKDISILLIIGARKNDIFRIFLNINLLMSVIAFSLSALLFQPLAIAMNFIITKLTKIDGVLSTSIRSFKTLNINSNLFSLAIMFIVVFVVTITPLYFSKSSPVKELKNND